MSIVNISKGFTEPLTAIVSNYLHYIFVSGDNKSYNKPLNNKGTPNYLVAPSNLDAILTLGDK